jgi:hypothetical protein
VIRASALPFADAPALRRARLRSLLRRGAAVAAAVGLAAALVALSHPAAGRRGAARGTATVVVLDLSGSIGGSAAGTIVRTLRSVARGGGEAGLVLFSDGAEEAVPPGSPASFLGRYVRLFTARTQSGVFQNPWTASFSAGTQIGRGLAEAREALARAGLERGRVVLVSDLEDSSGDEALLRHELLAYARDPGLELRIAAVPGVNVETAAYYRRILGRRVLDVGGPPAQERGVGGRRFPLVPLLLAGVLALGAATYELTQAPLAWRESPT